MKGFRIPYIHATNGKQPHPSRRLHSSLFGLILRQIQFIYGPMNNGGQLILKD